MKLGDISVSKLHEIKTVAEQQGVDPQPVLARFGISEALLANAYARISLPKYMRIAHAFIALTGKPWLGLLIGKHAHPGDLGLAGLAAVTAATLSDALATYIRFEQLTSKNIRGHSTYYFDKKTAFPICRQYSLAPYNQFNFFAVDASLSSWYTLAKWLTGRNALLKRVDIEYQDIGHLVMFEEFFQCPVHFGQSRNALVFSKKSVLLPSRFANSSNHSHTLLLCEKELASLTGNSTFRDRTIEVITPLLLGTPPSIEEVAEKMGIVSWTLRRRLAQEGTVFKELLNNTRKELAVSYVSDSIHNFSEIAYLLGFSTPATFHRAFKRWLGVSPGQYRKSQSTD